MSDRYEGSYSGLWAPTGVGHLGRHRGRLGCTCRGNPERPCRSCQAQIDADDEERSAMSVGRSSPDPDDGDWVQREEIAYERWLDQIGGSV